MSKNWDYSELAHEAKLNGGPEKYIELIRNNSMQKGRLEGKSEGKAEVLIAEGITFGIGLLGYAGYKAYTTIKERRQREAINSQEPDVKKAEAELIKGMNSVIEEEKIDAVDEDEEKDQ